MKKIVFTLCSNNYLAQAKTLGDSVLKYNPGFEFVIGLIDRVHPDIDYSFFDGFEVLPYHELGYPEFESMLGRYNIIEFNTSVKPFYFEYLFNRSDGDTIIYYLDPDIQFFSSLEETDRLLISNEFLVTPHITKPNISVGPFETVFLNVGIYNLGFLGLRKSESTLLFLTWWQERLRELCFNKKSIGLFVDQVWVNFLTSLFDGVFILKSTGYNMACWNFNERRIVQSNGEYYVNDLDTKLVFFHFSGFKPTEMNFICKLRHEDYTLEKRKDLVPLFEGYAKALYANKYDQFSSIGSLLHFAKKRYTVKQRIGLSIRHRVDNYVKTFFGV